MKSRSLRRSLLIALFVLAAATAARFYFFPSPAMKPPAPGIAPLPVAARDRFQVVQSFIFDGPDALKNWEEKVFKGKTQFQVLSQEGESYLKCSSRDASSGLYLRVDHTATPDLFLSWKWRALKFPTKKEPGVLSSRSQDDFAARIYVIFPGSNFFKSDVIEYVWSEEVPVGTSASSPFSERVKLVVLRQGPLTGIEGGWVRELQNPYEDYRRLFGKEPDKKIGVIALMSDSDNTQTETEADFGEIAFKVRQEGEDDAANKEGGNP